MVTINDSHLECVLSFPYEKMKDPWKFEGMLTLLLNMMTPNHYASFHVSFSFSNSLSKYKFKCTFAMNACRGFLLWTSGAREGVTTASNGYLSQELHQI